MRRRVRTTGCTKFLLVMIILIPLSFIGASLYNDKNPIDAFKELFGGGVTVVEESITNDDEAIDNGEDAVQEREADTPLNEELARKDRVIDRQENRIKFLEGELDKCQAEIQKMTQ